MKSEVDFTRSLLQSMKSEVAFTRSLLQSMKSEVAFTRSLLRPIRSQLDEAQLRRDRVFPEACLDRQVERGCKRRDRASVLPSCRWKPRKIPMCHRESSEPKRRHRQPSCSVDRGS